MWIIAGDGQITFKGAKFTIRGDENVAHNVKLASVDTYFHGGYLNDKVIGTTARQYIYTYDGDDDVTLASYSQAYTGDGSDNIHLSGNANIVVNSGAGDDRITQSNRGNSHVIDLGAGDDTISGSLSYCVVIGGEGNNTQSGNISNSKLTGFNDSINNIDEDENVTGYKLTFDGRGK